MSFEQRTKDMMKMAEAIATLAENDAPNFENVPGDVALRQFADAIRRSNAKAADFPSVIQ